MRIYRLPQVREATGLSRSTIYDALLKGTFPAPICLGARSVGWLADDVESWISSRPRKARFGTSQEEGDANAAR